MAERVFASREAAEVALAERLNYFMQRKAPEPDGDWDELTDREKEFLCQCIRDILLDRDAIVAAWKFMDASDQ